MGRLAIYGAGGFGTEVVNAARAERREVVLMDDEPGPPFDGIPILSPADLREDDEVVIAIGDGAGRRSVAGRLGRYGQVIAPMAVIGRMVQMGEGAIVCDYASITSNVRIGRHFQMNGYSFVAHDCVIGDFVTFAGAVQCNGNVHIGNGVSVGSGAIIKNGRPDKPLTIGEGATVGIGSVVLRSVPPFATVFENAAKVIPQPVREQRHLHVPR